MQEITTSAFRVKNGYVRYVNSSIWFMSRGSYSTTPMSLRIAAITCASRGVLFAAVDAILSQWPIEKLQPENQRHLKVGMEKADDAAGHFKVLANVAVSFICIQVVVVAFPSWVLRGHPVYATVYSIWWEDCAYDFFSFVFCSFFHYPASDRHGLPLTIFARFISVSGGWILSCKTHG